MKISSGKTRLLFSHNIPNQERSLNKDILAVRVVNLGRYLGVPLLHQRINKST